jgi:hypothetical protein
LHAGLLRSLQKIGESRHSFVYTSSDAVVNTDTVFIDDLAAWIGWHGVLRVRVDAAREVLVFATTAMNRIPQYAAVSSIPKQNLRASELVGCMPIGRCDGVPVASAGAM